MSSKTRAVVSMSGGERASQLIPPERFVLVLAIFVVTTGSMPVLASVGVNLFVFSSSPA